MTLLRYSQGTILAFGLWAALAYARADAWVILLAYVAFMLNIAADSRAGKRA